MKRKLIYSCVSNNVQYVHLLELLLISYKHHGQPDDTTDYLIICTEQTQQHVSSMLERVDVQADVWCVGKQANLFQSTRTRLDIFKYDKIDNYHKILYLDCDVLVVNNINDMLAIELNDKLYAMREGTTDGDWWGIEFFGKHEPTSAFSSGVMMFNNTQSIRVLFEQIQTHIEQHVAAGKPIPQCQEQPFIVYNTIKRNMHDNLKLNDLVVLNPDLDDPDQSTTHVISHFAGGPGHYPSKIKKMQDYMFKMIK